MNNSRLKRILITAIVVTLLMFICDDNRVLAQDYTKAANWQLATKLNPGWSLGNSLECQRLDMGFTGKDGGGKPDFEFFETMLSNPVTTKALIDAVAERGFKSIRIPVSFYNHLKESEPKVGNTPKPGATIDPDWLARIKEIVDWSLDAGLYVIINDHLDTSMYVSKSWIYADKDTIEEQKNQLTNIWGQYAKYFKNYDNRLIFQSMGEVVNPERSFDSSDYEDFQMTNILNQAFIDTVRKTGGNNADRFLILPTYASNAEPIFVDQNFCKPYADSAADRLIYSIHNYSTDENYLEWSFENLYKKAVRYGMPFVLTECGTKIKIGEERVAVSAKLVEQAEKYGMAIIIWDDGDFSDEGMGLVDRMATMSSGSLQYGKDSKRVIDGMFNAKVNTNKLTNEKLAQVAKEEYFIEDFTPLDAAHLGIIRTGMYSAIHADAFNPMSIYIPIPTNYVSIYPYVRVSSFDSLQVTLPEGITITIRELDGEGHFIKDRYVTGSGGTYNPTDGARIIGITLRSSSGSNMRIDDFRKFIEDGKLKIVANNYSKTPCAILKHVKETDKGNIAVSWEEMPGVSGYRIMRKKGGEDHWTTIGDMTAEEADMSENTFVDVTVSPNSQYTYTIMTYMKNAEGAILKNEYDEIGLSITTQKAQQSAKKIETITINTKSVSAAALAKIAKQQGASKKYVTKIVLGKRVKKIKKAAFKGYNKVKTLEVKTKKLKKKTVKGSLKSSKVKTIKVKVGSKKTNKKYVKKYKKIFTKKNAGKKVKVKR